MNRLTRPELIAAILALCTLDDTCSQESLEASDTQSLQLTYASMKRLQDHARRDEQLREERMSSMVPAWFAEEYP